MRVPRLNTSQLRRFRDVASSAARAPDTGAAVRALAAGLSAILRAGVTVLDVPADADHPDAWVPSSAVNETLVSVGLHDQRRWWLRVAAEWPPNMARRRDVLGAIGRAAMEQAALRRAAVHAEAVVAAAYSLSRSLARIHGESRLRQFIIDAMAGATRARVASLAIHDEASDQLRVVATHGYPAVLVEHVRLLPGEGVLGKVYESRRPMLVTDLETVAGLHPRRPRYRTPSFMAVPLLSNGNVLGVVSLADRADDRPFDRHDLTAARALAAPAALALLNDRLSSQARELAHAATVDPLTGLFNRRYFQTRIEEEMERSRRYGLDLALLLVDVDDFKLLNDELGHLAGDYLLRQIAEVLKRSVRVFDVCTRYGGEEFAILMPGSSASNGLLVAERIRSRVEGASRESGPIPAHLRVTVSLGLAVLANDPSAVELIARADRALYRAKADGKNCVRME